jgi:predicted MFS family arabinose efflux permease
VAVLVFLLAPKTGPVVLVFAAVMGLSYLSTVPPTVGLVLKFFGPSNMAMLFGIVMLSHQVGGFLGAWLGGQVFEATGSPTIWSGSSTSCWRSAPHWCTCRSGRLAGARARRCRLIAWRGR